jgi:YTH domain-containing family protein
MLRIFHSHPARTSLLQDFAFYEVKHANVLVTPFLLCADLTKMQKMQDQQGRSSPTQGNTSIHSPQPQQISSSHPTSASSPGEGQGALQMSQITPMTQMHEHAHE